MLLISKIAKPETLTIGTGAERSTGGTRVSIFRALSTTAAAMTSDNVPVISLTSGRSSLRPSYLSPDAVETATSAGLPATTHALPTPDPVDGVFCQDICIFGDVAAVFRSTTRAVLPHLARSNRRQNGHDVLSKPALVLTVPLNPSKRPEPIRVALLKPSSSSLAPILLKRPRRATFTIRPRSLLKLTLLPLLQPLLLLPRLLLHSNHAVESALLAT